MEKGNTQGLPELPDKDASLLFYLFEGEVSVNNGPTMKTGESLWIEQEKPEFKALAENDIVLFVTDKNASSFEGVMYSGNQLRLGYR